MMGFCHHCKTRGVPVTLLSGVYACSRCADQFVRSHQPTPTDPYHYVATAHERAAAVVEAERIIAEHQRRAH